MDQHIRRLDADADDPGEQPHHRMRSFRRRLFQLRQPGLLDRPDLVPDDGEPRQIALDLGERVRRDRQIFRCPQRCQPLPGRAQFGFEAADAEPGQRRLHAVDDPRALPHQVLTLAARTPGVLFLDRRDGDHPAMPALGLTLSMYHFV